MNLRYFFKIPKHSLFNHKNDARGFVYNVEGKQMLIYSVCAWSRMNEASCAPEAIELLQHRTVPADTADTDWVAGTITQLSTLACAEISKTGKELKKKAWFDYSLLALLVE